MSFECERCEDCGHTGDIILTRGVSNYGICINCVQKRMDVLDSLIEMATFRKQELEKELKVL